MALAEHYLTKRDGYYMSARQDYVRELPSNPAAKILEIGCGNGATGALALLSGKCGAYIGVEMFGPMAELAAQQLTAVHCGDVESMSLPYEPASFDALICSEVLEHLVDPLATLRRLVPLLLPGGLIFASSPNIANAKVALGLLFGRFDYTDEGVMDRTHLRWFTPDSYRRLFEEAGASVDRVQCLSQHGWKSRMLSLPGGRLLWSQIDLRGRRRTVSP